MPELRWVECACGYRTRVEIDQRGLRWECPVCSLECVLTEQNTTSLASPTQTPGPPPHSAPAETPPPEPLVDPAHDVSLFEEDAEETPDGQVAPPEREATAAPAVEAACDRCGRSFRGDWDRVEADGQAFCNICANLASKPIVAARRGASDVPDDEITREIANAGAERWGQIAPPEHKELSDADRRERRRHLMMYAAFSAAILLAILLWPSEEGQFGALVDPAELPPAAVWFVFVTAMLAGAAATVGALYLTLSAGNALPNDDPLANVIAVSSVGLPLWFALKVLLFLLGPLMMLPLIGPLLALAVRIGVLVSVVQSVYQLRARYMPLLVVSFYLAEKLEPALKAMLQQAIGGLFA